MNFKKLGPIGFSKKPGHETTIVSLDSRGISRKDNSSILKKFTDKFKNALGPDAESLISQDNENNREERRRLKEAETQLEEAEKINALKEATAQKVQEEPDWNKLKPRLISMGGRTSKMNQNCAGCSNWKRIGKLIFKTRKKR